MAKSGFALRAQVDGVWYLEAHPEVAQHFKQVRVYSYCENLTKSPVIKKTLPNPTYPGQTPQDIDTVVDITSEPAEPPFLERLKLSKGLEQPTFNILGELKNLYIKIPLLQVIQNVLIYAKTIKDIYVKKPGRKPKDPLTVHVVGDLSMLMSCKIPLVKYGDPGSPNVTVQIGQNIIPRGLVDLGAAINIMPIETTQVPHM